MATQGDRGRIPDDAVSIPFPGSSPETMDDLRQEVGNLRQKAATLEAEKAELAAQVKNWKTWYASSYRPQIQFLDSEMNRLCSMIPMKPPTEPPPPTHNMGARSDAGESGSPKQVVWKGMPPSASAPPGLRRGASETRLRKSPGKASRPGSRGGIGQSPGASGTTLPPLDGSSP
mmetsp:Transcript_16971/g.50820  ORF Transcript_16971/g.50820 Transcript_16971/m.50820 type:complete len:174 (+) Transcript_16971:70-591(+)